MFVDSHCHLDFPELRADLPAVLARMKENGVTHALTIGETGLDYCRVEGDTQWQRERFRTHIRAARACGKPLVIHTRSAAEDTLRIMGEEGAGEAGGVMHCFTET